MQKRVSDFQNQGRGTKDCLNSYQKHCEGITDVDLVSKLEKKLVRQILF